MSAIELYNTKTVPLSEIEIKRSRLSKTAKVISDVFSPPVLGAACIVVAAIEVAMPGAWLWVVSFLALTVGIPTGYVLLLVRKGKVSDFHIPIRRQRIRPMILMVGMALLSFGLLLTLHPPTIFLGLVLIGLGQLLLLFLITLKWKISGHALAASSFCSLCTVVVGASAWLTFLLVPVVVWSRLRLRRHTFMQTAAGTALGLSMILLVLI